jgi:hypothetical protein
MINLMVLITYHKFQYFLIYIWLKLRIVGFLGGGLLAKMASVSTTTAIGTNRVVTHKLKQNRTNYRQQQLLC